MNDKTFENVNVQDDVRQALRAKKTILIVYEVDYARGAVFEEGEYDFKKCLYDQAPADDLKQLYTLWKEEKVSHEGYSYIFKYIYSRNLTLSSSQKNNLAFRTHF